MRIKCRYLGLRVPPTLANQIQQAAAAAGQNQADWLRRALNDAIHTNTQITTLIKTLEEIERRVNVRFDRIDTALTTLEIMDDPLQTSKEVQS